MRSLSTAVPGRARPALLAICAVALLAGSIGPADAQSSGDSDTVDVLTATREEVRQAVDALDERYEEQQAVVDEARARAASADDAVQRARARVDLAQVEVDQAREVVRDYAVEAYIRPPEQDSLRVLSMSQADDAGYVSSVLKIMAEERHKVVDVLVEKQAIADRERSAADAAAEQARAAQSAAEVELIDLDRMRSEQQDLADSLDERLDAALAEAAALAAVDQQMADELAAQELDLRSAGPASAIKVAGTSEAAVAASPAVAAASPPGPAPVQTTRPPATGGGTSPPPAPTTRPPTTRPPTTTPPAPPSGGATWADMTRVGGIWVNKSIAGNVGALLNAATAAGFNLAGGGYRDPAGQIATRRANCGTSYYDIYLKPSSQCSPPTAIPGRSMHERGLAIDFTSSGSLIRSRSTPAFVWLKANAARYGLYNLPSEPWHWSTTGG